jgi:hypothetical protein
MDRLLCSIWHAMGLTALSVLLLGSTTLMAAEGPSLEQRRESPQPPFRQPEPFVKPPPVNRTFTGEIGRVLPQQIEVHIKDVAETVTLHFNDTWTRQLKLAPGAVYGILAHQRHTPGGITTAVKFNDERGLYALAETIHDVPLFTPHDRDGIEVDQEPLRAKTFVYEDPCKAVYNVPAAFTVGQERVLVQPHETKTIELHGKPYTLTLNNSQFIVLKDCPVPFEGGRSQLDYSVVRTEEAGR